MVKDCEIQKEEGEGCPKWQTNSKEKLTVSVGHVERQITLKNDDGRVQVRISRPNVPGLKTLWIATQTPKQRKLPITPHRPTSSPQQRMMIQKTSFATTRTPPPSSISDNLSNLILQKKLFMVTNNK